MIDLKRLQGDRYRVTFDPSAQDEPTRAERPWLYRLEGRYGFIGVHSKDRLLVHCHAGRVIPRVLEIPGIEVKQRGDMEVNCLLPIESLVVAAEILKCKKRRRLTPEQRERAIATLKPTQFARA